MGSGSLAAMAMLESQYKDDLTEEEAKKLVTNAIRAGIFNDLGSGSNVDLVVMRVAGETEYLRNYQTPNDVALLRQTVKLPASAFNFPAGSTRVVKTTVEKFNNSSTGGGMEIIG